MGILDTLTSLYREQVERHHNRPFLEAVMSAAALVCMADGKITFPERVRLDQIINAVKQLEVFDPHEAVNLFNEYTEAMRADPAQGHEDAFARIEPEARDPEKAALILRICLGLLEVEGENAIAEQIEIVSLCTRLGIEPKDCGLYIDKSPEDFLADAGR